MEDTQVEPLLSVIKDLTEDPAAQEAFATDPAGYLEGHGYGDLEPEDLTDAFGFVAETLPPDQAMALAPPGLEGTPDDATVIEAMQRLVEAGEQAALEAEGEEEQLSGFGEGTGDEESLLTDDAPVDVDDGLDFGSGSAQDGAADRSTTPVEPDDSDGIDVVFDHLPSDGLDTFTADDEADYSTVTDTPLDPDPDFDAGASTPDDYDAF